MGVKEQERLEDHKRLFRFIEFDEPDERYWTAREVYVTELVNSPLEFGTTTIPEPMPDGEYPEELSDPPDFMKSGWTWFHEVDIAMHPYYGALVCGSVLAPSRELIAEELESEIATLKKARAALWRALDDSPNFDGARPPIGLFIVMMNADKRQFPFEWDMNDAWLCSIDQLHSIRGHMMTAMEMAAEEADPPFTDYGARFVAAVRSLGGRDGGYTSALEWLNTFGLI